ncbi:hypothetical protein N7448_005911 [Penicillium atrosanguineum]|uniref:uncharacterized protein n=1 Tax=Penicillium atrosanguineum TaxID=1132637 RepID=UPI0023849EC9|nr:uncharacterized protein N7443_009675 [Penicillium atrosanguineum]KAJ5131753.1 hypothetical protein N7448_005911 [Penicillium atrosanguineum]KAJ5289422.1 hypothetical protein N7443_009675 [Penicillium atrosanguineum]
MSSESLPINPAAFAEAIKELPLSAVHSKLLELRNSIAHLHRSNAEMRLFLAESEETEEEKKELQSYVEENEGVVVSMSVRTELLKTELENRGKPWVEIEEKVDENGAAEVPAMSGTSENHSSNGNGDADADAGQEDGVYL